MRRLLLISFALLGLATAGAFGASKQANASFTGTIKTLSPTSITVGSRHRHVKCNTTGYSPGTHPFATGDRVRIACANHVLVAIADFPSRTRSNVDDSDSTSGISGAITALTSVSITAHDGDRTLTCSIRAGSPSTSAYGIGVHAKLDCADGVLVTIGAPGGPTTTSAVSTPAATVTSASGPIVALTTTSITVQTMPCQVGAGSPSTDGLHVGDSVRMYCLNGVLYQLKRNDTPLPASPTTTTTTTTQQSYTTVTGSITVLSGSTITVAGGDSPTASLSCSLGTGTPATSGFSVGNAVRMYCVSGALYELEHNGTPSTSTTTTPTTTTTQPTTTTTTTTATQPTYFGITGTITVLAGSTITVVGGDTPAATLTCSLGAGSPSTAGFAVGNSVRMYCTNDALYQLKHDDTPVPAATTTTTMTTTTPTTTTSYTYASGQLQSLTTSSITVGSGEASTTCSIGEGAPNLGGFAIGNSVGMYCTGGGALYALNHR